MFCYCFFEGVVLCETEIATQVFKSIKLFFVPFEGLKFHRIKQFFLLSYHHNLIFDNHFTLLFGTNFSPIFFP